MKAKRKDKKKPEEVEYKQSAASIDDARSARIRAAIERYMEKGDNRYGSL